MIPTTEELRAYGRIPSGSGDGILQLCIDAAVENLRGQGVPPTSGSRLYTLCALMLALHYYDNRGALSEKSGELPFGVMSIVNQLHYAPPTATEVVSNGI